MVLCLLIEWLNGFQYHNNSLKGIKMKKLNFAYIKDVFETALDLEDFDLKLTSKFEEVPDWDSMGHMRIILELEERLGIAFEIDEVIDVDTVEKILQLANSKLKT